MISKICLVLSQKHDSTLSNQALAILRASQTLQVSQQGQDQGDSRSWRLVRDSIEGLLTVNGQLNIVDLPIQRLDRENNATQAKVGEFVTNKTRFH